MYEALHIRAHASDGGGVDPHDRIKIQNSIKEWTLTTRVVEHFGGPATVLQEVREALSKF